MTTQTALPVTALLDGVTTQDFTRLAGALADDVHLTALVPRGLREWDGREQVTATFTRWFGDTEQFQVVDAGSRATGPRVHLWWRVRLRAQRLGDGPFVVEQRLYADTDADGRITRLSLLCSGFCREES
jgi:hypothetical protein